MGDLPIHLVARAVREALLEDLGAGDLTCEAVVAGDERAQASILAGEPLVAAGLEAARCAFLLLDPQSRLAERVQTGERVEAGAVLLGVEGRARAILSAERTALNFLGRLCGIATLTRRCVDLVAGSRAAVFDTRKTTPGLRLLERHAVAAGGGRNHRSGLWDAVLIKNNHRELRGGAGAAVRAARGSLGPGIAIEVEVSDLAMMREALAAGAGIILLDNMTPHEVADAVRVAAGRAVLEASGGISLANLREYAETGVDRISLGMITHSAPAADVKLRLRKRGEERRP